VYELGELLKAGAPARLQRYGASDYDAYAVGLTCGGIIDVFIEPIDRTTFPDLER
jgi:xanthine dehydrogenase accessory factor